MKTILKILGFLIVLLLALGVFSFLFRNSLIKFGLQYAVTRLTGFKTKIEEIQFNPPSILVKGLRINNPSEFNGKLLADVPELYLAVDLDELLHGVRIHLYELRVNLKEIYIEKNEKGVMNISRLSSAGAKPQEPVPTPTAPSAGPKKVMPFYLERFELTIRRVTYVDYTSLLPGGIVPGVIVPKGIGGIIPKEIRKIKGKIPADLVQKKFSMDLNIEKEVFTGIDKPQTIIQTILFKVLYGQTFHRLKDLGVDSQGLMNSINLQNTFKSVASSGEEVVQQTKGMVTKEADQALKEAQSQMTGLLDKFKKLKPTETTSS